MLSDTKKKVLGKKAALFRLQGILRVERQFLEVPLIITAIILGILFIPRMAAKMPLDNTVPYHGGSLR